MSWKRRYSLSNWKSLTVEEANGPGFNDAVWYSTTNTNFQFGLLTDDLHSMTGYRSTTGHYGGVNNLTLYHERDIVAFLDRRNGRTFASAEAVKERLLQFRRDMADLRQAKLDQADPETVVPVERLSNLPCDCLQDMARSYCGHVGLAVNRGDLVNRIIEVD